MKLTKKQKVAVLITLTIIALVIVFKDKLKALLPSEEEPSGNGTETEVGDEETYTDPVNGGGSGTSDPTNGVFFGCNTNCCQTVCNSIAENAPEMNVGCCGPEVYNWQTYLNTTVPNQVHPRIPEDGAYGPQTKSMHQAYLNMMPSVGEDLTGVLFEEGSGSSGGQPTTYSSQEEYQEETTSFYGGNVTTYTGGAGPMTFNPGTDLGVDLTDYTESSNGSSGGTGTIR